MIVTGDRDAYQLPDDGRVRVMTTSRGITDTRVYDSEGVVERYGIPPELVPDFIGLKGDTSDNIPGVPGIGDKTAAQLLQQYGSLEGVLDAHRRHLRREAQAEPARERRPRAPVEGAGHAEARHRRGHRRERARRPAPDRSRLREVFARFELRDPLRRLEEALGEEDGGAARAGRRVVEATAREGGRRTWRPCRRARRRWRHRATTRAFCAGRRRGGGEVLLGQAETLARC